MDSQKRAETIKRGRAAVAQTKALYESAKKEFQLVIQHSNNSGAAHPSGILRDATSVKRFTWRNYKRAVREHNRFVLDGTLPGYEK
jgi:hypothetical protein